MLDNFVTPNHFCTVFERLGDSLHEVLQNPCMSYFPLYQAKEISRQLVQATRFLHDNGIIHTDLRPENILFVSATTITQNFYGLDNAFHSRTVLKSTELRIVDFGSVYEPPTECSGVVGLTGFRAPEVVMGWQWTETIDHFTLGCIITEVLTSQPLFQQFYVSTAEDIAVMDKILGPFPDDLVDAIKRDVPNAFEHRGDPNHKFSYSTDKFLRTAKTIRVSSSTNRRSVC
ncbi:kinase-like domain-containing protein [Mycena galericulata]|nr:kinase-like domain-containing protein [Mycena galericulata]